MTSILRSPIISSETRKLAPRHANAPAKPVAPAAHATPVSPRPQHPEPPAPDLEALLAQARESVLAQFKQEAETARELGRQRGLQEGRAAGAEEVHRNAEAELARIRAVAAGLHGALDTGIRGLEDVAVAIAFEAVCKMLGSAAASRDGIRALVHEAVEHAAGAQQVTVRLHPADLATLRAAGGLEPAPAPAPAWVADKSVELGGCVVETDGGTLDARLETQVERLRATLLAARAAPG
jgi:flagellar biosynthesis/type III secretory pathway protein FliH